MKRLSNTTNINKGQEVPSINVNLQIEAAQYLFQQGQAKAGGVEDGSKNKFKYLKETYKIEKEHLAYMKQPLSSHAHIDDP